MGRLFLLFTLLPVAELYLLLWVGRVIGFWPTLAFIAASAVVGAAVARREGFRVLRTYQQTLAQGRMPEEGLLSALLVLLGGVLLITPGVITDVAGVLLLVPPTRKLIAVQLRKRLDRSMASGNLRVQGFEPPPRSSEPSDSAWDKARRRPAEEEDADVV